MAENRRNNSEILRNCLWDGKLANQSMLFQALADVYWRTISNHSQGRMAENIAAVYEFSLRNSIIDITNLANLKLIQCELLKVITCCQMHFTDFFLYIQSRILPFFSAFG